MASNTFANKILPRREQVNIRNQWLTRRLDTVLPQIMAETSIDMWVILAREFNEDPILFSMFPAPVMNASRLTGLIFSLRADGTVERFNLYARISGAFQPYYQPVWEKGSETQWERLSKIIQEKDPRRKTQLR